MIRTVWECRRCGEPCVLIAINEDFEPDRCPYDGDLRPEWRKTSECELPEDFNIDTESQRGKEEK